jgi:hypothetical protein
VLAGSQNLGGGWVPRTEITPGKSEATKVQCCPHVILCEESAQPRRSFSPHPPSLLPMEPPSPSQAGKANNAFSAAMHTILGLWYQTEKSISASSSVCPMEWVLPVFQS